MTDIEQQTRYSIQTFKNNLLNKYQLKHCNAHDVYWKICSLETQFRGIYFLDPRKPFKYTGNPEDSSNPEGWDYRYLCGNDIYLHDKYNILTEYIKKKTHNKLLDNYDVAIHIDKNYNMKILEPIDFQHLVLKIIKDLKTGVIEDSCMDIHLIKSKAAVLRAERII